MSSIDDVKKIIEEKNRKREMETGSFKKSYFESNIELGIFNYTLRDVSLKFYKYTSHDYYSKDSDIIITEILFNGKTLLKLNVEKKLDSLVKMASNNLHGLEKVLENKSIIYELENQLSNLSFIKEEIINKNIILKIERVISGELFDFIIETPFSYTPIKIRIKEATKEKITETLLEYTQVIYRNFYLDVCKKYMVKYRIEDYFNNYLEDKESKKIENYIDFNDFI